jgi:hypothetical protein
LTVTSWFPKCFLPADIPPRGHLRWTLADGSAVLAPYYLGTIRVGALGPFPALVTVLGDEPLIGREIVAHFTITLDHGERVIVEL